MPALRPDATDFCLSVWRILRRYKELETFVNKNTPVFNMTSRASLPVLVVEIEAALDPDGSSQSRLQAIEKADNEVKSAFLEAARSYERRADIIKAFVPTYRIRLENYSGNTIELQEISPTLAPDAIEREVRFVEDQIGRIIADLSRSAIRDDQVTSYLNDLQEKMSSLIDIETKMHEHLLDRRKEYREERTASMQRLRVIYGFLGALLALISLLVGIFIGSDGATD